MDVAFILDKYFKGTLIFMEIGTGEEIDPNQVVDHRADECIAKLLLEMPLAELKRRTTFRGLNPLAERSVLVALQRRYKVLSES